MAVLTSTHNLWFEHKYKKSEFFYLEFSVFGGESFYILDRRVFVMVLSFILFLISFSFGGSKELCFVSVIVPEYLHSYFLFEAKNTQNLTLLKLFY